MSNSLFSYAKQNKRIQFTFIALFLPLIGCFLFALLQGAKISDLYLPSSQWNDEILYFKQIEAVVKTGQPLGYFGYNESTAARLTFGAWSPVIMLFYVIWGKLLGWGLFAPFLCNLFLFSMGLAFLVWQTRMDGVHFGLLAGFVVLFIPFARFTMSVMADMEMLTLLLFYMGCYFSAEREERADGKGSFAKVYGMLLCALLLTLMRPYFVLLFVFPGYHLYRDKKPKCLIALASALVSTAAYFYIAANYSAAYLTPIINTDWLKTLKSNPVVGLKNAVRIFVYGMRSVFIECIDGIRDGKMEGNLWLLFMLLVVILMVRSVFDKTSRAWLAVAVMLLGAIVMFYDVHVGSRHLMTFILPIAIVILFGRNWQVFGGLLVVTALCFTIRISADPYNYKFPVYDADREAVIAELRSQLRDDMTVDEKASQWDNTVIWLHYDDTMLQWQYLYSLPEGIGINLCMSDYVTDNMKNLQAKYIAVNSGETIDKLCSQAGFTRIARAGGMTIWAVR